MSLSVIVCCYNSALRIQRTLECLASQQYDSTLALELILVDNNSSDGTADLAVEFWEACGAPFPMHVVQEKRQGLAHARVAGVVASTHYFGIFCDDDNWLPPNYITTIFDVFMSHPSVGVVGSAAVAVSDVPLPAWFYRLAPLMAVGTQSTKTGDVTVERPFVWGAGMGVRLYVLRALFSAGIRPRIVGRNGTELTSGDDAELCVWFLMIGYRVWYEGDLVIQHYMPEQRLNDDYRRQFLSVKRNSLLTNYFAFVRVRYGLLGKNHRFFRIFRQLLLLMLSPKITLETLKLHWMLCKCHKTIQQFTFPISEHNEDRE